MLWKILAITVISESLHINGMDPSILQLKLTDVESSILARFMKTKFLIWKCWISDLWITKMYYVEEESEKGGSGHLCSMGALIKMLYLWYAGTHIGH